MGNAVKQVGNFVEDVGETAVRTVRNIAKDPLPFIEAAVLTVVLGPEAGYAVFETQAGAAAAANAAVTFANGGSIEDAAKAGVVSYAGAAVGGEVASALPEGTPGIVKDVAKGAAGGATKGVLTGKDPVQSAIQGATTSAVASGLSAGASKAGELFSSTPDVSAGGRDYLTEGLNIPGQGFKATLDPNAPPGDYFAPSQTSYGISTDLPQNVYAAAGGTGLYATTPEGEYIQQDPDTFWKATGRELGRRVESKVLGSLGSPTPSSPTYSRTSGGGGGGGTSALTSTGLFTPQSIVPTGLTGIAPISRGKPILGSEDEEATGAWGTKTLRA